VTAGNPAPDQVTAFNRASRNKEARERANETARRHGCGVRPPILLWLQWAMNVRFHMLAACDPSSSFSSETKVSYE
jgi:hypothetical protein